MINYQSDSLEHLVPALLKAQAIFMPAKKNKSGQTFFGKVHRYADLGEIIDATRQPLADNDLCVLQPLITREDMSLVLRTQLLHKTGEYINSDIPILMPPGSTPQQIGSCITYFKRYAYAALIGIVADEDDDAQAAMQAHKDYKEKGTAEADRGLYDKATSFRTADRVVSKKVDPTINRDVYISADQVAELNNALQGTHESIRQSMYKKYNIVALEQIKRADYRNIIDTVREFKEKGRVERRQE